MQTRSNACLGPGIPSPGRLLKIPSSVVKYCNSSCYLNNVYSIEDDLAQLDIALCPLRKQNSERAVPLWQPSLRQLERTVIETCASLSPPVSENDSRRYGGRARTQGGRVAPRLPSRLPRKVTTWVIVHPHRSHTPASVGGIDSTAVSPGSISLCPLCRLRSA